MTAWYCIIMRVLSSCIILPRIFILYSLHYINACGIAIRLFTRVDVVIILNIDIVIHIVHMLLLIHDFTTLVVALPPRVRFPLRSSILLIGHVGQTSFLRIWYLSWLCHTHWVLIVANSWLNRVLTVILMKPCNAARSCVHLLLILDNSRVVWSLISQANEVSIACWIHASVYICVTLGSKGWLCTLTKLFLIIWLRISCNVSIIIWFSHLTFCFISVCSSYLFQALNLTCHST